MPECFEFNSCYLSSVRDGHLGDIGFAYATLYLLLKMNVPFFITLIHTDISIVFLTCLKL